MDQKKMDWWREAKFGLFIHWGLYSIPARGEWDMLRSEIPLEKYRRHASNFNPVKFSAQEWVKAAKDGGMRYLVYTSKHHDGFAMYDSKVSNYNIVEATPYAKDPMKELAKECANEKIKFGIYYSHDQDWDETNAGGDYFEMPPINERDFKEYFYNKCYPQLHELMTNYGTIWELFLDTPRIIDEQRANEIEELIHALQPMCLIDSRIGPTNDYYPKADYISCFDNTLPSYVIDNGFEVPATITKAWGYKYPEEKPDDYRNTVGMLIDIVGMGGNYLLNVGPRPDGSLPEDQVAALKEVGDWLKIHGDAIYSTHANPFERLYDWGSITTKNNKLFINLFQPICGEFKLNGLVSKVKSAYYIHNKEEISFTQNGTLVLDLSTQEGEKFPIVVLEFDGKPEINVGNHQQGNGEIILESVHAVNPETGGDYRDMICSRGTVWNTFENDVTLTWDINVTDPGKFAVELFEFGGRELFTADFKSGGFEPHELTLTIKDTSLKLSPKGDFMKSHRFNHIQNDIVSNCGELTIDKAGTYKVTVHIDKIAMRKVKLRSADMIGKQWDESNRLVMNCIKLKPIK